jgi:hypothetical protein
LRYAIAFTGRSAAVKVRSFTFMKMITAPSMQSNPAVAAGPCTQIWAADPYTQSWLCAAVEQKTLWVTPRASGCPPGRQPM